jgi:transcriptional regulator GlxA family with amidase domain
MAAPPKKLGVLLFPRFELLDVFGPLEMFGYVPGVEIVVVAPTAGPIPSTQGPSALAQVGLDDAPPFELLLVPGGIGTRDLVHDAGFLESLASRCAAAELVMSVCTGSALLARAGVLDGRRATSNKKSFGWVVEQGPRVRWQREARWVWDDRFVTSSGVAAGIDMALAVVAHLAGSEFADALADRTEYEWQRDPDHDRFAGLYPPVEPDQR